MKIRAFYTRNGDLKFISHLNTIDLLQRGVFSTDKKIAFTKGFNPRPKMSFGNPLPLGVSSDLEVFDVEIIDEIEISEFIKKMNEYLPEEIQIIKAYNADTSPSISKIIEYSIYEFTIYSEIKLENVNLDFEELMISRERKSKKGSPREFIRENIGPNVKLISSFDKMEDGKYRIVAQLENSLDKIINPVNFILGLFSKYNMNISIDDVDIHKKDMK